jgi:5-methylcytosine-specific restriction enzyme A
MTGFTPAVRSIIVERSGGYCERGGRALGAEAHHRRPRGMGGTRRVETNLASNGLWLCHDCHRWTELNRTAALRGGWLVEQNEDPRRVPVLYRGAVVYLDDLGNLNYAFQETTC